MQYILGTMPARIQVLVSVPRLLQPSTVPAPCGSLSSPSLRLICNRALPTRMRLHSLPSKLHAPPKQDATPCLTMPTTFSSSQGDPSQGKATERREPLIMLTSWPVMESGCEMSGHQYCMEMRRGGMLSSHRRPSNSILTQAPMNGLCAEWNGRGEMNKETESYKVPSDENRPIPARTHLFEEI